MEVTDEAKLKEPKDEITLETLDADDLCEKLIVIARHKVDNHNIGIEYNVKEKLENRGTNSKKVKIDKWVRLGK